MLLLISVDSVRCRAYTCHFLEVMSMQIFRGRSIVPGNAIELLHAASSSALYAVRALSVCCGSLTNCNQISIGVVC